MSLLSRLAVQAARAYGVLSAVDKNKVSADYLVVAGGGGSGGGGGGAGGLLTSTANLSKLNTYSVAVGAGGAGVQCVGGGTSGVAGSNSSISGTGLTTITSTGGGFGGGGVNGGAGGSGGGAGSSGSSVGGGAGTSGQGNNGGSNGAITSSPFPAGGGGGAGAVGGNATSTTQAGNGGNGTASSISGSSVTYAGGGGGGYFSTGGTATTGGTGGGGGGNSNTGNAVSGTANTGGGGGGTGPAYFGGSGGSGVVIIAYTSATPLFVGGTITTSGGKQIHTFTSSGTLSPITPITASYLVVAGGGSGGSENANGAAGGGGGAGGLLTGSTTIYSGATYVVTVGAGAASGAAGRNNGIQGSNSVLSGTGLTTLTSTGGGYGACYPNSGGNGGSGGGGGSEATTSGGTGTSGQGNNGGGSNGGGAGGGGGAGAAGGNGTSSTSGAGGVGVSSSISGTATYYAGGGGGGYDDAGGTQPAGAGGNGGGGAGGGDNSNGVSGTPNTGGGGGGKGQGATIGVGGQGGSGVVIISYAGSQAFNGGLVTSSGGNTIHTFTSTGALTPLTNNLTNSLRFRSSASAYLNRTPASASNRKTWTWSAWVKRGALGSTQRIFASDNSGVSQSALGFNSSDTLFFQSYISAFQIQLITTQVFRDPSAWYHIVLVVDTTQATAANRTKMYINGNQVTAFSTATYSAQNYDGVVNGNFPYYLGTYFNATAGEFLDGYLADVNFIDGQALEPYYFGNNDANGVWKPILYKGTYGTNGFYLTFGNTTSTTTLGYDSSPNGNNWTTNNISLTAGTTYDAMTDVPTNTSATTANYAVMNPIGGNSSMTLLNGNLNTSATAYSLHRYGTIGVSSGKWYWEVSPTAMSGASNGMLVGISNDIQETGATFNGARGYFSNNGYAYTGTSGVAYGATWTTNDILGIALDLDAGTLVFYKNNVSQGTAFTGLTGEWFPLIRTDATVTSFINFGQRPFAYTPPTGFVRLNTFNLPTPTILQGNKYMDATLATGNESTQVIVNQAQFKPDFVWMKVRSAVENHISYDSVRGVQKYLVPNLTLAEATLSTGLTSFNSNGFTLGNANPNYSGSPTFVAWQWQAGQGSTTAGTGTGGITSVSYSVSTTAGFSVVTYTGSGANGTVTHGLGVAPKMIIFKGRSSTFDWMVYHTSLGNTNYLRLNQSNASAASSSAFNNTSPTSTVFSLGDGSLGNNGSSTQVAYCWAEIAGFSKAFSYTGNGSADGVFTYLGFTPKFIIIKNASGGATSSVQGWIMLDTSRSTYNQTADALFANNSNASNSSSTYGIDILSNGFKTRGTDGAVNESSATYIGMAFASNPFKNSNAR